MVPVAFASNIPAALTKRSRRGAVQNHNASARAFRRVLWTGVS